MFKYLKNITLQNLSSSLRAYKHIIATYIILRIEKQCKGRGEKKICGKVESEMK